LAGRLPSLKLSPAASFTNNLGSTSFSGMSTVRTSNLAFPDPAPPLRDSIVVGFVAPQLNDVTGIVCAIP